MNQSEIKNILRLYNLDSPKKELGQNFLMKEAVLQDIVSYADLSLKDEVIEIGPGLGVLSQLLAPKVGKLHLVELDEKLIEFLQKQLFSFKNINYIHGDILRVKVEDLLGQSPYKIVANIPYNITSKIFRKFSDIEHKPEQMVILVQKEVAERVVAEPGAMSVLAVILQFYYNINLMQVVPNSDFYPAPKVNSAVLKMKLRFDYFERLKAENLPLKRLWQIVKIGFSSRRKKLLNNLANGLHLPMEKFYPLWEELGWDQNRRAQELSVNEWIDLLVRMI